MVSSDTKGSPRWEAAARSQRVVATLLFASGFSALVYQTAWQRSFRLTFGASSAAAAAVLAIFLGGLGVGGVLFGRRAERSERPLLFYANLELGVALWAALSPLFAQGAHRAYLALGGEGALGTFGATVVRLLLAALTLGPATVLMGGTLPAAVRAVVARDDEARSGLALVYAVNTLGAVVGALAGPLLLFGLLGTRLTLWAAVCVNLLVAVLGRALGRAAAPVPRAAVEENAAATATSDRGLATLVYALAGAAGFAFVALELVWYRMLAPLLGGSTVAFGFVLAAVLLGIGLGGYAYALRGSSVRSSLALVALTLTLEAVAVALPFAWGDELALVAAHLHRVENLGYGYLLGAWSFVALVVVLPAAAVSGYQFPALVALLGRGNAGVARQTGFAYAANTLGALGGALLGGLWLLPALGAVGCWRYAVGLLALLGAGTALAAWRRGSSWGQALLPAGVAALALAAASLPGPGPVFRHTPIGAGRVNLAEMSENQLEAYKRGIESVIAWEEDGLEAAVAINVADGIAFVVNGKSDGSTAADAGTMAFVGLLPAALHGHAKSAFVVGLGTGMSAGLLGRVPGIEHVEVAELEPSVLEVARRAWRVNGRVLENPRVRVHLRDGREELITARGRYDLVLSEPSNPYRAGVAALFTQEFYASVREHLRDHGLFAQWLQGYEIDATAVSTVLRSMRSVFPEVSIWGSGSGDLILIGSLEPQVIDVPRLRALLREPAYATWMHRAWLADGAEGLVARHLVPPSGVDALLSSAPSPINTDDLNVLETRLARLLGDQRYAFTADAFGAKVSKNPRVSQPLDGALVEGYRQRAGFAGYRGPEPTPKTRAVIRGCAGDFAEAARLWPPDTEPRDPIETWVLGHVVALRGGDSAPFANALAAQGFEAEASLVRAFAADARGERGAAVDALLAALAALSHEALPLCDASSLALARSVVMAQASPERAGEILAALARGPFATFEHETDRKQAQALVGSRLPDPAACLRGLGSLRRQPVWELPALVSRALCLRDAHASDADAAWADVEAYLENEPATFADPLDQFRKGRR